MRVVTVTRRRPFLHSLLLAVLLSLALVPASRAQSLWSTPYIPNQLTLEVLQPALEPAPGETISMLTSASTLGGSYLLTDRTTMVVGLPVAHYQSELEGDPSTELMETQIGNPYVGLGVGSTRAPLLVELGLRLPLAPDATAATRAGQATDLVHGEAFAPHTLSAQLMLNTRWERSRVLSVRLRGGPLVTIPTQGASGTTELYARYGLQGWYTGDLFI